MKKPEPYQPPTMQCPRPGADTSKIPSIHLGKRIEHVPPKAQCVGLKFPPIGLTK